MKTTKTITISVLAIAFMLLAINLASATVTVTAPAAGANVSGNFAASCSYVNGSDISGPIAAGNVSFRFNSTGADEVFLTRAGLTITNTTISATLTSTEVTDGVGTFKCLIGNQTIPVGFVNGTQVIRIDNVAPTLTIQKDTVTFPGGFINYKCSDPIAISSFVVAHPTGEQPTSTSLVPNSADYVQFTDVHTAGNYVFTCTDEAGNAATHTVVSSLSNSGYPVQTGGSGTANAGGFAISGGSSDNSSIIVIVIIILVVVFLAGKKRK